MLNPEGDDLELVYNEEEPDVSEFSIDSHILDTSSDISGVHSTLHETEQPQSRNISELQNGAVLETAVISGKPLRHSSPVKGEEEQGQAGIEREDVVTGPGGRKIIRASPELTAVAISFSSEGEEQVTMTRHVVETHNDGRKVIRTTPGLTDDLRMELQERPLKERDMRFLRMFSILSMILFLPTGIAAFVYARKTKQAFEAGIERGDLDEARKLSRRTERLIMLSIVLSLFTAVLAFSLAENALNGLPNSLSDKYDSRHSFSRLP